MSVYKSKRGESSAQFVETARLLHRKEADIKAEVGMLRGGE